jgi:hypothetical protein
VLNEIGEYMEEEIVSRHSNVRLLLCGHHRKAYHMQKTFENGRTFTAVMVNLQAESLYATTGYCMLVTFDPVTRSIGFTSYSPFFDDYDFYPFSKNETFTLENAF